jgi:kynurenine formamidase
MGNKQIKTLGSLPALMLKMNMPALIDLTHAFTDDMPVYPGDDCSKLYQSDFIKENGVSDHKIESGMHVGTHIDAPLHMVEGGAVICEFPVDKFQGRGILIDARAAHLIDVDILDEYDIQEGDIVLVWTDWSKKFRSDHYYKDWPHMSVEFAKALVHKKIALIGMDTPSPDPECDDFPAHKTFLPNNVLIIENMTNLNALEGKSFKIHAYPMKYEADAAPVRVVAELL